MMEWLRKIFACYLLFVGVLITSSCQADTINAEAIQQDPRLEKLVTLSARRIPLKVILDRCAIQTGVTVTINELDPASGYPVLVECNQMPLGKLMNALYSLLSIRGGEWKWMREGKDHVYTYSLYETTAAKNRADTYHSLLEGLLDNYLSLIRRLAPLPMEERKRHRDELKKILYLDSDAAVDTFFAAHDGDEYWDEVNFFCDALTPQQQQSVLQGTQVTVSVKDLPSAVYSFYHNVYLFENAYEANADGIKVRVPEAETLAFQRLEPDQKDWFAPKINMVDSKHRESWMGTGHLEVGIRDALKQAWMLPGDKTTDDTVGELMFVRLAAESE